MCHSNPKLLTYHCASSETKFLPLFDMALLGHPLRQINLLKLLINACESNTKSNKIARDDAHVYKVIHALYVFRFSLL